MDFILKYFVLTGIFLWSHLDWSSASWCCNLNFHHSAEGLLKALIQSSCQGNPTPQNSFQGNLGFSLIPTSYRGLNSMEGWKFIEIKNSVDPSWLILHNC